MHHTIKIRLFYLRGTGEVNIAYLGFDVRHDVPTTVAFLRRLLLLSHQFAEKEIDQRATRSYARILSLPLSFFVAGHYAVRCAMDEISLWPVWVSYAFSEISRASQGLWQNIAGTQTRREQQSCSITHDSLAKKLLVCDDSCIVRFLLTRITVVLANCYCCYSSRDRPMLRAMRSCR